MGRDAAIGRPKSVAERGLSGAIARLDELVDAALAVVPDCPGADALKELVDCKRATYSPVPLETQSRCSQTLDRFPVKDKCGNNLRLR